MTRINEILNADTVFFSIYVRQCNYLVKLNFMIFIIGSTNIIISLF